MTTILRALPISALALTFASFAPVVQAVPTNPTPSTPNITIYMPLGFAFGQTFGSTSFLGGGGGGGGGGGSNFGSLGGGGLPNLGNGGSSGGFFGSLPPSFGTGLPSSPSSPSSPSTPYLPPSSNVTGPQSYTVLPGYVPPPPAGTTVGVPDTGVTALLLAAALVLTFGFHRRIASLLAISRTRSE